MKSTQAVNLIGVKVFANHGFYPQEQLLGGYFLVDIYTQFDLNTADTEDLKHTVNYEILNQIILEEMAKTQKLLETLVHQMAQKVKTQFPFLKSLTVKIKKLNPPMGNEIAYAEVAQTYDFS